MSFKKVLISITLIFISSLSIYSLAIDRNMAMGIETYKKGDYLDSIHYFNNVLELDNELYNEALFWKAKSFYSLDYYKESKLELEDYFRKSNSNTSYYEDARFLYCKVFFKLENFNDALLLFNQFYRNKSFNFYKKSAKFWVGECYLQLSELDKAKEAFLVYLDLSPNSTNAKNRIDLIERMQALLFEVEDSEITIEDKAKWFVEFIVLENKGSDNKGSDNKSVSEFLNKFESKDNFFEWLVDFKINKETNVESSSFESAIISDESVSDLNALEEALLIELEDKLLLELGDGN